MATVWYTCVGFGPCYLPNVVSPDRAAVWDMLEGCRRRDVSGWTTQNSRVYGYGTQEAAIKADISDDLGTCGRVE